MPSFDTVLEPDMVEVRNAMDQAVKEIGTRFDFKGTQASAELGEKEIIMHGDSDFQLDQVRGVVVDKLTRRKVDVRFIDFSAKPEKVGGKMLKLTAPIKMGIEVEQAKKLVKLVKDSKMKVQASIQGDTVRITGKKRDDLQAAMALFKEKASDMPLSFKNFRD